MYSHAFCWAYSLTGSLKCEKSTLACISHNCNLKVDNNYRITASGRPHFVVMNNSVVDFDDNIIHNFQGFHFSVMTKFHDFSIIFLNFLKFYDISMTGKVTVIFPVFKVFQVLWGR